MSTYNIREKFSYVIATSSVNYVRNYNFNSTTVTDIPLAMANSDETIPITVNITTTEPWMAIVDATTGKSLKYPEGNVVLQPASNKIVLLKIDLPPEIESIPQTTIRPFINLDITSGSFPIYQPTNPTPTTTPNKNTIIAETDTYTIDVGERVEVNITVYDDDGKPVKYVSNVNWKSNNMSIVQVEEPENTQVDYDPYTPRIIRGISPGETTVIVTAGPEREATIKFIVRDNTSQSDNTRPSSTTVE